MTPTDDRGAAALEERLADVLERPEDWTQEAAAILGERGRFLPDGNDPERTKAQMEYADALIELARLRRIEAAARAFLYDGTDDPLPDDEWADTALALRAALESEG